MDEFSQKFRTRGKEFLVSVERSDDPQDYHKYERLRMEVWGDPLDTMAGDRNLHCENYFDKGGALYIAVHLLEENGRLKDDWDHFAGFSYGFVGVKDKKAGYFPPDNFRFYSQYTAVKKDFQEYGLGVRIKEFQRKIVLESFKVEEISCTFDPLSGINAYRNIHHFGMDILAYKENLYGNFGGFLNRRDIPCDRFFALWRLREEARRPDYDLEALVGSGRSVLESRWEKVDGKHGSLTIELPGELDLDKESDWLLIEIPYDFYRMLTETHGNTPSVRNIPLDWRMKTREALQRLFARGYGVIDFETLTQGERSRNFYVLLRE